MINSYLLGPIIIFVFCATSFILPSAVKEHFSGSPQRMLMFKNKLCELWFIVSFRKKGYESGYDDVYNGRPHRVNVEMSAKEEASGIAGKC